MTAQLAGCRVHFPPEYDERGEWEAASKGYLQGVTVELADGLNYPVFFYDPVRLAQDLESDAKWGRGVIAEPAMVVVSEVTRAVMLSAAEELVRQRYFDHLKPLSVPTTNGVMH